MERTADQLAALIAARCRVLLQRRHQYRMTDNRLIIILQLHTEPYVALFGDLLELILHCVHQRILRCSIAVTDIHGKLYLSRNDVRRIRRMLPV